MSAEKGRTITPQQVECPDCLAPVGWACRVAGVPVLPHHARVQAARENADDQFRAGWDAAVKAPVEVTLPTPESAVSREVRS